VVNKPFTDALFVGFGYSGGIQELQTGFEQKIVYGLVTRENNAFNGTLRYKKEHLWLDGLSLNLFASVSQDHSTTADTVSRQYYWDGSWTSKGATEMGGINTLAHIIRPRKFLRGNLTYAIN